MKKKDEMKIGLYSAIFILLVINILLALQVYDNSVKCSEQIVCEKSILESASRDLIESATQSHPLFALEKSLLAKYQLDDIIMKKHNGSMQSAEKLLNLKKGELSFFRQEVESQIGNNRSRFMDVLVSRYPEFDSSVNYRAGIHNTRGKIIPPSADSNLSDIHKNDLSGTHKNDPSGTHTNDPSDSHKYRTTRGGKKSRIE